jgi:hypothetical protein
VTVIVGNVIVFGPKGKCARQLVDQDAVKHKLVDIDEFESEPVVGNLIQQIWDHPGSTSRASLRLASSGGASYRSRRCVLGQVGLINIESERRMLGFFGVLIRGRRSTHHGRRTLSRSSSSETPTEFWLDQFCFDHGGAIAISPAVDVQLQYNQARIVEKTLAFRTTHPGRFSDLQIRSYGHATSLRTRNSDKDTQLRSSSSHGAAHHTTANARSLNQRRMLSI